MMYPRKIPKKKLARQLSEQTKRERICAIAMCHKTAIIQAGDLNLCEEHKDCIPMLPFNFFEEMGK